MGKGAVPEKQMIFRFVLLSDLGRSVVDMFLGVTAGGVTATGILKVCSFSVVDGFRKFRR